MSDESNDLSQIEFTLEKSDINKHCRLYINVKGRTLEECRKHFEEIKKDTEVRR